MIKKITRNEMWNAIIMVYPSIKALSIDTLYNYVMRDSIFKILIELKVHKSRHLNKEQKQQIENELNERAINKL